MDVLHIKQLDEFFQILNLFEKDLNLKGLIPHWNNITWRSHQDVYTSREQVSCIYLVCESIDSTYKVQTYTSEVVVQYQSSYMWLGICV